MNSYRKIIHVDMDAFYASVEQLDDPALRGKPLVVGGQPDSRGVVAACSYEARKYGIHSAMPCSKAVKLCPRTIFISPRMHRYKEISAHIMQIFSYYTELIEPLSLDEAFLDVTANSMNNPSATRLAEVIRSRILQETQLTASAGVSYNKFLAKIASDLNKPNGISVILPKDALAFLNALPVGKFFGVGKVTEKKMLKLGIRSGRDLRQFSKDDLIFHFGKSGAFFYEIVRGNDNRDVQPSRERKSIGSETTLQEDTSNTLEIDGILHNLALKIEMVMQRKDCIGSTVTLKVRYHDFTTATRSTTTNCSVNSADDICKIVNNLIPSTEIGRKKVRLLGIAISKLSSSSERKPFQLKLPFMKMNSGQ